MILVKSRDCLAASSTASCSTRLMCPGIDRKASEDEGEDKECRRMSMHCTIGLDEWGTAKLGERRENQE
mgnify:CR=1 FL=1